MKKEEILKSSRQDNKQRDLYEIEVENKAVKAATLGILLLSTTFYVLEIAILKVQNYGWYSIIALYCTVLYGYKAIKLPKKYNWFLSVVWLLATIACITNYVIHRF